MYSKVGGVDKAFSTYGRDAVMTIPGQFQTASVHFQEPRIDLHVKLLRVLPSFRRVVGQSDAMHYRVQMLGENGVAFAFNMTLNVVETGLSTSLRPTAATEVSRLTVSCNGRWQFYWTCWWGGRI